MESDRAEEQLAKRLEKIAGSQPPSRDFDRSAARNQHIGREYHYEKAYAGQSETESKLCRSRNGDIPGTKVSPYTSEYRSKDDDQERVDRLKPKCRHFKRTDITLRKILGKQI